MTTINQNVEMYSGDSKTLNVTVTLTGTLVGSTIKWSAGMDYVPAVTKTTTAGISITGATTFTVALLPEDTENLEGTYLHEAQVTDLSGNVSTVMTGKLKIIKDLIE